jgi:tRNA-dihydrouridine synthase
MLYNNLPQPFLVLAPMDDVTDIVFRSIVAECAAPDMYFTEFVNVDGLQSVGHDKLLPRLRKGEHDKPIIAQLWGLKPENFEKSAAEAVELGFDGIDLNFGCPDKTVVKNGACSAMIHNRDLAHKVIEATQRGAGSRVPVSAKTRLGFNEVDLSWHEFLLGHQLDALLPLLKHCSTSSRAHLFALFAKYFAPS